MDTKRIGVSGLGGVNLLADPAATDPSELVYAKNIIPVRPGVLGLRPPTSYSGYVAPSFGAPVAGILASDYHLGGVYILDGAYLQVIPGSAFDLNLGATTAFQNSFGNLLEAIHYWIPTLLEFQQVIYAFPGYGFTGASGKSVAFTGVADYGTFVGNTSNSRNSARGGIEIKDFNFLGVGNAITPGGACQYRSRVAFWNFGPGLENYLIFSDNYNIGLVGDNALTSRAVQIGRKGERIVGCVEIMLTAIGSPAQSALLVLTNDSAYLLTGEPLQTTVSGDIFGPVTISKIAYNCGCVSKDSIVTSTYGTFWVSRDDVWFFAYGTTPVRIGTKIRPVIQGTAPSQWRMIKGAYFDGFIRYTMAGDGQSSDNVTPLEDQWWLDLRDGVPTGDPGDLTAAHQKARWWGPIQHRGAYSASALDVPPLARGTFLFIKDQRPNVPDALMGIEYGLGDSSGTLFEIFSVVNYAPTTNLGSRDFAWDVSNPTAVLNLATVNTVASYDTNITMDIRSKEYSFDEVQLDKVLIGAEISVWVNQQARIYVDFLIDGDVVTTSSVDVLADSFQLDVAALDSSKHILNRALKSYGVWADPTQRFSGKLIQARAYTQPEILVTTDNNEFAFVYNGTSYTATLTTGVRATTAVLAADLAAAMNTAVGAAPFSSALSSSLFQLISSASTWFPAFQSGAGTADQRIKTRKLGALLGFDTSANPTNTTNQVAASFVSLTLTPVIEFGGINLAAQIIPRRPLY